MNKVLAIQSSSVENLKLYSKNHITTPVSCSVDPLADRNCVVATNILIDKMKI